MVSLSADPSFSSRGPQEGQYAAADKYAEIAINADRYNAHALVNKGNCLYMNGEYGKAADYYKDAMDIEASCVEAVYNLGKGIFGLQTHLFMYVCICMYVCMTTNAGGK